MGLLTLLVGYSKFCDEAYKYNPFHLFQMDEVLNLHVFFLTIASIISIYYLSFVALFLTLALYQDSSVSNLYLCLEDHGKRNIYSCISYLTQHFWL